MKRFIAALFVAFTIGMNAQTSLNTAVNFTATDCNGNVIDLFEILDRGQYVLLDFFYFNCGPCQKACPKLVEAYEALGCNEHDVFFMEISYTDSDEKCHEWDEKFNVKYPTIGADGGGLEIADAYGINSFPTVILISPRKSILIKDFPYFETSQDIVDKLTSSYIIDEYPCSDSDSDPDETDVREEVSNKNYTLYPNPASSYVRITSDLCDETIVKIIDITGRCVKSVEVKDISDATIPIDDLDKGVYFMTINNNVEKLVIE